MLGYVYVITTISYSKNNIVKIGCSKNLKNRLKCFNSVRTHQDCFFIKKYWRTCHYFMLEAYLKNKFSNVWLNNEFYKTDIEEITKAVIEFTNNQTGDFFFKDIIYINMETYSIKWDNKLNIFMYLNDKKDSCFASEYEMQNKIRDWLSVVDRHGIYTYLADHVFDSLLSILKTENSKPSMGNPWALRRHKVQSETSFPPNGSDTNTLAYLESCFITKLLISN